MSVYNNYNPGPQQVAVAPWTADHPSNQGHLTPIAPPAIPGPHQVMAIPEALENYAHQWHMALSENPAAVPGPQQVTAAMPETFEVRQSEWETFSYAETTWIRVDETAREMLSILWKCYNLEVGWEKFE